MTIRNPVEWGADFLSGVAHGLGAAGQDIYREEEIYTETRPAIRRIALSDLREALARGFHDFTACRSDVVFLCLIYPLIGLVLGRAAMAGDMLPMIFPLASGFALIGPLVGVGLYEMSRRREQGLPVDWRKAFGVLRAPSIAGILLLGLVLVFVFFAWQYAALAVLTVSVVSFPMMVDRHTRIDVAVATSLRAVAANPGPMAAWGAVVAGLLVLGTIPFFAGLVVVLPVLGHATWHLYRRVVAR